MDDPRSQWDTLKSPRPPHGKRLLIPQIDIIAREEPQRPWIAVPIDDADLTLGYKDITFGQFANAANTAAHWLRDNLSLPSQGFPAFAYTGPPDFGYALMAVAAGKLGYQMIPFGKTIKPPGQQRIMEQKNCTVYLHAPGFEPVVDEVQKIDSRVRTICAPELKALTQDVPVDLVEFTKSWQNAKDDPWLVFHTSGTTGMEISKVIDYTQSKISAADVVMGLEDDIGDNTLLHYVKNRYYLPMPPTHYVSMFMTLGAAVWVRAVPVYGPGGVMPSPSIVKNILKYGSVDGAILVPALLDALCRDPESLDLLRKLKTIQYAGAPLRPATGKLLSPDVRIVRAIGSTDPGGYFMRLPNKTEDWDYVALQPHSGAVMEHRVDHLYELVFIQHPRCTVQSVFQGRPDLTRFETGDLWEEHPTKKGQWKLVGREDDLIKLSDGSGVIVTPIEMLLTEHPLVKNALVGGHGKPKPIILIEPVAAEAEKVWTEEGRAKLIADLAPHIDKVNLQCPDPTKLDTRLIVFASLNRPWPLTMKDTPVRTQVLKLYGSEIESAYARIDEDVTKV